MIVRACDFVLVLLRDEKDLVRGFSSRAMRRVRVTTRRYAPRVTPAPLSIGISSSQCREAAFFAPALKFHRNPEAPAPLGRKPTAKLGRHHPVAEPPEWRAQPLPTLPYAKETWQPQPVTVWVSVRSVKNRGKESNPQTSMSNSRSPRSSLCRSYVAALLVCSSPS
jgi:hypothetical protein